jgi:hypothetical protein
VLITEAARLVESQPAILGVYGTAARKSEARQEHLGQQQAARALPQGGGFSLLSLFLSKKTIKNRKSEIREPDRR